MLGVQIKSNYRQCGPSASLRKDIGDSDGYLMFFLLLLLCYETVSEFMGEDLSACTTSLQMVFLIFSFSTMIIRAW